jgi:hypothetical protein
MPKKPTEKTSDNNDTMWVATGEVSTGVRGGAQQLKVGELAVNVNLFVQQMGKVLESTPDTLGKFHFDEFEIHAEISADGKVVLLGSGVEVGAGGGVRFVFRRTSSTN